jgi:hypothetical protein
MQHLLILDYRSDAERKRIDYMIEKWSGKADLSISKPKGVIILFEGENLEEFLEDIYSRIDAGANPPQIYSLEESRPAVEKRVRLLTFTTNQSVDTVQNFINYLLAKQNAAFEYSDGTRKIYAARTRKGHVQIMVNIEGEKEVRCHISIEGYGDVVDFVAGRIEDEMNIFLGGVGQ